MNEQIRELSLQAKEYATTRHPVSKLVLNVDPYLFEQKFAQLIVQECAKIADDGCGSACFGLGINGAMLKEHFGVEE